ncbi:hypothetical protein FZZ93_01550 [Halomonas eurihalina]|uniref:Uncharacterized protein n=1 Tax=Halomonas eurihalina TaxID=42566 RepID=A0A5D9DDL3_HALER|nr:hypothetical protein [Halomonas eurihalina]MDR5858121.1 hypothetical protein [Halomonas eurihalina]TZG41372.1 hypothetical protein FZZ93_01550 [Halomonas eurihalina]
MLISDSISLLWLSYGVLSLVVLGTGYLGLAFLPRLPRLVITWAVAGVMWVPSSFSTPLNDAGDAYTGMAPAVVVGGLAFLEKDGGTMASALLLVAVAAALGGLLGLLLWRRGRVSKRRSNGDSQGDRTGTTSHADRGRDDKARREPVVG